jgi:hypothetical protein
MNLNNRQSAGMGIFLIALGLMAIFGVWWLLVPGVLATAGAMAYKQRRLAGRPAEAVQVGLWCIGLALLFLTSFPFWPGVLILAGASFLIRGREVQVDEAVQRAVSQASQRRAVTRSIPTQQVPIATHPIPTPSASAVEPERPNVGDTTRL